jgi:hypothetical protein
MTAFLYPRNLARVFLVAILASLSRPSGAVASIATDDPAALCPPGSWSPNGQDPCFVCPAGTYNPSFGQTSCLLCGPGTYSSAGSAFCTPCPIGYANPSSGSASCNPCAPGYFSSIPGSATCSPCAPGYFSPSPGSGSCLQCAAGYYSNSGSAFCTACPAGYYSAAGSGSCTACAAGTFSNSGSATCSTCPDGFIAPAPGSSQCQACPPGTTSDATHTTCVAVSAASETSGHPVVSSLGPATPNPASSFTTFNLALRAPGSVSMNICDVTGRLVRSFDTREYSAGTHAVTWDLNRDDGSPVRPGVYYARMQAGSYRSATPILVVR